MPSPSLFECLLFALSAAFDLLLGRAPPDAEAGFAAAAPITSDLGLGSAQLTLATDELGSRIYTAWNMEFPAMSLCLHDASSLEFKFLSSCQGPADPKSLSLRHCANCFKNTCTWLLNLYFCWCIFASGSLGVSKTPSFWRSIMYLHPTLNAQQT